MDNLFNSQKLFFALYRVKALAHGVVRTLGRGFPPSIRQDEEKNANKAEQLKGTTKAAVLKNSTDAPEMLAVSIYDNKPVHLMTTASEKVEWVLRKRKVWLASATATKMMSYMRLNLIDDYNQFMNSTDIADQLRNSYRPDHWLRNRKWWWAIFLWAIGVAQVNAFRIYCEMYDDAKRQKRYVLPKKWSHREFVYELVLDLMSCTKTTRTRKRTRSDDEHSQSFQAPSSTRSGSSFGISASNNNDDDDDDDDVDDFECDTGIARALQKYKPFSITHQRMKDCFFSRRFDGKQHPSLAATNTTCQYCRFLYWHDFSEAQQQANQLRDQNRKHVRRCLVCNVNLCPSCELEFHGISTNDVRDYFRRKL
jgi:hypothetical protein